MFKPITKAPKEKRIAAFDVQGDGERGCVVASLVTDDDERVYTDPEDLIADMTTRKMRGSYVYSHRLTYDAGVLIPQLPADTSLLFLGEKLFKGRLPESGKHRVYLADSSGLWGGLSCTRIAEELGVQRLPPPESLVGRKLAGNPWQSDTGVGSQGIQDYSASEARIVLQGMHLLQDELHLIGSELKSTLAATAMDLFRRCYLDDEYYTPFKYRNDFARRAYYGGRCEPYVLGWCDSVSVYDFHSHYPAQMAGNVYPDPNSLIGPRQPGKLSWILDYEGCSDCTVDVPHCKYPPLPHRIGWQVFYPVGVFRGVWCHNELRYAMEHGVRIKRVHATLYSEKTVSPFTGYVTDLWEKRGELKKQHSPRQIVYKLLLNSLSGKFGQREEGSLFELRSVNDWIQAGRPTGTEFLELRKVVYAKVPVPVKWLPDYIIVPWAAYITSYGRIALHKAMMEVPGPVLYVDTDSIHCYSDLPIGKGLGDLDLQAKGAYVDYIAPKMYQLVTSDGESQPVAKGIPSEVQGQYCTYKEVEYWHALGWLEAARYKLDPSVWVEMKKKLRWADPKRRYKRVPNFRGGLFVSDPLPVNLIPGHH